MILVIVEVHGREVYLMDASPDTPSADLIAQLDVSQCLEQRLDVVGEVVRVVDIAEI